LLPAVKDESRCIYTYLFYENLQIHIKLGLSENLIKCENEIVIFVLSAQNDCFLLGHRMSFWSRPSSRDFKLIRMRQQNNHLSHEIQTLFFLQPHFKIFEFLHFCKIFLGC
jgi:hypothetical protein